MNTEFMRESTAVDDFYHPPFTIIGKHNDQVAERVAAIYSCVTASVERTSTLVAELDLHHLVAVDADSLTQVSNLIREAHLIA